ncbi:hypothetical protein V2J09_008052 [Rumex salicifolius]
MATSVLSPISSAALPSNSEESLRAGISGRLSASSFLPTTKPFAAPPSSGTRQSSTNGARRWFVAPRAQKKSFDHVPKQFREENLKEGLKENFKNVPQSMYGLTPSQMDIFNTVDNPISRQSETVTEESISSSYNYLKEGGMWSLKGTDGNGQAQCSMATAVFRGGARGYGRRPAPPDLPSLLLDSRIVYLGMPIVPAVTELLIAEFMWLDYDDASKPIYLYINSPGTQNEQMEIVGSETEAYAIADAMSFCKAPVYTVNVGMALGQAAMLLALGAKGYRAVQPNSSTKLYLPKIYRSSGAVLDMWLKAKELDANTDYYLELLSQGIGKSKEEIAKDISRPRYFRANDAIEYGIADRLADPRHTAYQKKDYDEMLNQSRAMRRAAAGPGGPRASPSGFS